MMTLTAALLGQRAPAPELHCPVPRKIIPVNESEQFPNYQARSSGVIRVLWGHELLQPIVMILLAARKDDAREDAISDSHKSLPSGSSQSP